MVCGLQGACRYQRPTPTLGKLQCKAICRIFKISRRKLLAHTQPRRFLLQPISEANPNEMARGKVILSLKYLLITRSSLANFSRVAEAEVAVEVVAVVVAAASVRTVITVTAPTSPKHTRKWSFTTMSSLHCRKKRRRLSGMRSVGSCPTASDSAAPKGRVPLRRHY